MKIGNRTFEGGTRIMGILNVTPDSFFAGSRVTEADACRRAEQMLADGAEVLDLGAQSTRPSAVPVPQEEELRRLRTVLPALRKAFDAPLSVDTYFPAVARYALDEGADLINDVRGLAQPGMAETIAAFGASVCIVHNAPIAAGRDLFSEISEGLRQSAERARSLGIAADRILLDGGIGFGKTREENLALLAGYERLSVLRYPLLLGTSRKSLFGDRDRLEATLESTRLAVRKGVLFVRVHDVKENFEAIREAYENLS